jgi:hypothetical protein
MNWRARLGGLLGGTPKPAAKSPTAKSTAKSATPSKAMRPALADSPRAKVIAEAKRIHRAQSANIRAQIAKSIDELQRAGPKTLRDPEALERLMGLIQAQRALSGLMGHDLKRYLVLGGLRQFMAKDAGPPKPPKPRVVRR